MAGRMATAIPPALLLHKRIYDPCLILRRLVYRFRHVHAHLSRHPSPKCRTGAICTVDDGSKRTDNDLKRPALPAPLQPLLLLRWQAGS